MNKIFLRLEKGKKNTAKYIIFSIFFVFAFLCGFNGEVNAAFSGSIFSSLTNDAEDFAQNNTLVDGDGNSITSIDGDLINKCIYTDSVANDNVFSYELLKSAYTGGSFTAKDNLNCVSYIDGTEQTFYLQGDNSTNAKNTITFNVSVPKAENYKYVAVFEDNFSMSKGENGKDYDIYALQSGGSYVYSREASATTVANRPLADGTLTVGGETGNYTLTITYTLREFDYQQHKVFVYFYDAKPATNNQTARANLVFTLARPINTYGQSLYIGTTDACDFDVDNVCIVYSLRTDTTEKTNKFTIKFSNSAAFYFSTVNTHSSVTAIDPAKVEQYNSIYATNTFYNEGEESNPITTSI